MAKSYAGRVPNHNEGWRLVGKVYEEVDWLVFRKEQAHSQEWATYKVVADGKATNKANYWLVRNDLTKQIGFARDFVLLREHRPKVHEYVENVIFKKI